MNKGYYTIKWRIIRAGQSRAYADSLYEYEVESELHETVVKQFCNKFLFSCDNEAKVGSEQFDGNCSFPFGMNSFYKFKKVGDNLYNYLVCEPYTD